MFNFKPLSGGSWFFNPRSCRSASRIFTVSGDANFDLGFRVVCLPRSQPNAQLSDHLAPVQPAGGH